MKKLTLENWKKVLRTKIDGRQNYKDMIDFIEELLEVAEKENKETIEDLAYQIDDLS